MLVWSDSVCVCVSLQLSEVGSSSLLWLSWWRHMLTLLTSPELSLESSSTTRRKRCSRKSGTGWDSNHRTQEGYGDYFVVVCAFLLYYFTSHNAEANGSLINWLWQVRLSIFTMSYSCKYFSTHEPHQPSLWRTNYFTYLLILHKIACCCCD